MRFTTGFLSFTFCQTTLSSLFKNSWCKKHLNEFWKYSSAERLFFQELVPSFSSRTILNRLLHFIFSDFKIAKQFKIDKRNIITFYVIRLQIKYNLPDNGPFHVITIQQMINKDYS
ncbi:Hypothetical_protein [Hexamita inflata]|uniref:Hypothetical_protein n=1 Tax=Hexamita inflata TaxID=28002 RepID=A0AA86R3I7_9EUKA|nr:Hypothetical protein HINF_LOCUS54026 [Hexamita inflata]